MLQNPEHKFCNNKIEDAAVLLQLAQVGAIKCNKQ